MPKLRHETLQDFKARVIDVISPSFCAAKWYNATIWLNSGQTASCHHPLAHTIDPAAVIERPSALHNTPQKKLARSQMLNGERPAECAYCWIIEDVSDVVSDRVLETSRYSDELITEIARTPVEQDVVPRTLEIAFDRACNFACSYCNAAFSTTWANDIRQHGPYEGLTSQGTRTYTHDSAWAEPFKPGEANPYLDAFWRWWPELSQTLQELRVTGGEPTTHPEFWRLLDQLSEHPTAMHLAVNSNLGVKEELMDRLIAKSQSIAGFTVYTSCESVGQQAEYIRDGLIWQQWLTNAHRLMAAPHIRLSVMMTVNNLCLFGITDLLDLMLGWKAQYGFRKISWSANLVRFPQFQSALVLPESIKLERLACLQDWLAVNRNNPLLRDFEIIAIERLIDFLASHDTDSMKACWPDVATFYEQYDRRRGKDIRAVFPANFIAWYDSLR
jgi:organic radical activating enzyme